VSSSTDKLWKFEISIFLKQAIYYIKLFIVKILQYILMKIRMLFIML